MRGPNRLTIRASGDAPDGCAALAARVAVGPEGVRVRATVRGEEPGGTGRDQRRPEKDGVSLFSSRCADTMYF